jgi:hypothetical protein
MGDWSVIKRASLEILPLTIGAISAAFALAPMGEDGGAVEVDETDIGRVKGVKMKRSGSRHKNAVLSLLDREPGKVRSFRVA